MNGFINSAATYPSLRLLVVDAEFDDGDDGGESGEEHHEEQVGGHRGHVVRVPWQRLTQDRVEQRVREEHCQGVPHLYQGVIENLQNETGCKNTIYNIFWHDEARLLDGHYRSIIVEPSSEFRSNDSLRNV